MIRAWRLKGDDTLPGLTYSLATARAWGLPGVHCDVCGATWSRTSVAYPWVDLRHLADTRPFTDGWPVPRERLEQLRSVLREECALELDLPPGLGLGPLEGRVSGKYFDFAADLPWEILARTSALEKLRGHGVELCYYPARLTSRSKEQPDLNELYAEPLARLHPEVHTLPQPCSACGRQAFTAPDEITLVEASIPTDRHLFRGAELPTHIFASEAFMCAVREEGLLGLSAIEVDVRPWREPSQASAPVAGPPPPAVQPARVGASEPPPTEFVQREFVEQAEAADLFVSSVVEYGYIRARDAVLRILRGEAQGSEAPSSTALRVWYDHLDAKDREIVHTLIRETLDWSLFNILYLLDGLDEVADTGSRSQWVICFRPYLERHTSAECLDGDASPSSAVRIVASDLHGMLHDAIAQAEQSDECNGGSSTSD